MVREPWDQPWIEYFALTTPADFDVRQLVSPLRTWFRIYGSEADSAAKFGKRVYEFASYRPGKKPAEMSHWGLKIRSATDNLWEFLNHSNPKQQLLMSEADIALTFIRVITAYETISTFDFVDRRGTQWLPYWPQYLGEKSSELRELASQIVRSQAGWVSMLASLQTLDQDSVLLVQSWLHAFRFISADGLHLNDPDNLLDLRTGTMTLADKFRKDRVTAIWNAYQVLGMRDRNGWAIYGPLRMAFESILEQIDPQSKIWFIALANRRPKDRALAGACLMLTKQLSRSGSQEVFSAPGLRPLRDQLLQNIADWTRHADKHQRITFDNLRRHLDATVP